MCTRGRFSKTKHDEETATIYFDPENIRGLKTSTYEIICFESICRMPEPVQKMNGVLILTGRFRNVGFAGEYTEHDNSALEI